MPNLTSEHLMDFLKIFDFKGKSELEAHAKTLTVYSSDLAALILTCNADVAPIGHLPIHRAFHPEHLHLTEKNREALAQNGVGPLGKDARKTANKIMASFRERRLFNAHFFWIISQPQNWHLFYFDQRDTSGEHWAEGPHIHLMNHLTHPQINGCDLLQKFIDQYEPPKLSGLHLRYKR